MTTGKFHNEDLSILFFIKSIDISGSSLGSLVRVVDGYPYNEIESGALVIPTASIEAGVTSETGVGEFGASWFRRAWAVDVFASTDVQRDDLADRIFQALNSAVPIKDYSVGYRKDTGLSIAGTALRVIEYANVENRTMRPAYAFNMYQKVKYWRSTVGFETVSTSAT